jgi:hypothetical protein
MAAAAVGMLGLGAYMWNKKKWIDDYSKFNT